MISSLGGWKRNGEALRRIGHIQTVDDSKLHYLTIGGVQRDHCSLQAAVRLPLLVQVVRGIAGDRLREKFQSSDIKVGDARTELPPIFCAHFVNRDAHQPALEFRLASEIAEVNERLHDCLLNDVFGIELIANHSVNEAIQRDQVRL